MAKVLGSESVRQFGYQQMREERQRQADALNTGNMGKSLMALGADEDVQDDKLRALGLATSLNKDNLLGQIAGAVGQFKAFGANEKKREADRGRKDIMTKMLLKGDTDISLDEYGMLAKENPIFVKGILDLKEEQKEKDRLKTRREKLEGQEDEDREYKISSRLPADKVREYAGQKIQGELKGLGLRNTGLGHSNTISGRQADIAKLPTFEEQYNNEFDEKIIPLLKAQGVPEAQHFLYKDNPQLFLDHALPLIKDEEVATRLWNKYGKMGVFPTHVKSAKDVMLMQKMPPALMQRMVQQAHATKYTYATQELLRQMEKSRNSMQAAVDAQTERLNAGLQGAAESFVKSQVVNGVVGPGLSGVVALGESASDPKVLEAKILDPKRALSIYMNHPDGMTKEAHERYQAQLKIGITPYEGAMNRLAIKHDRLVAQNPKLGLGYLKFDSKEDELFQLKQLDVKAIYQSGNGGFKRVEQNPQTGEKFGVDLEADEVMEFTRMTSGIPTPGVLPTEQTAIDLIKEYKNNPSQAIISELGKIIPMLPEAERKAYMEKMRALGSGGPHGDVGEQGQQGPSGSSLSLNIAPEPGSMHAFDSVPVGEYGDTGVQGAGGVGGSVSDMVSQNMGSYDGNLTSPSEDLEKGFIIPREDGSHLGDAVNTITGGALDFDGKSFGQGTMQAIGVVGTGLAAPAVYQSISNRVGGVKLRGDEPHFTKTKSDKLWEEIMEVEGFESDDTIDKKKNDYFDKQAKAYGFKDVDGPGKPWTNERIKKLHGEMKKNYITRMFNRLPIGAKKSFKQVTEEAKEPEGKKRNTGRGKFSRVAGGSAAVTTAMLVPDAWYYISKWAGALPDKDKPAFDAERNKLNTLNTLINADADFNATQAMDDLLKKLEAE
jgi:hypothetical protein